MMALSLFGAVLPWPAPPVIVFCVCSGIYGARFNLIVDVHVVRVPVSLWLERAVEVPVKVGCQSRVPCSLWLGSAVEVSNQIGLHGRGQSQV